jgi:hypothetical protein
MSDPKIIPTGITYMGRPIEELAQDQLVALMVGQDFVIERLVRGWSKQQCVDAIRLNFSGCRDER